MGWTLPGTGRLDGPFCSPWPGPSYAGSFNGSMAVSTAYTNSPTRNPGLGISNVSAVRRSVERGGPPFGRPCRPAVESRWGRVQRAAVQFVLIRDLEDRPELGEVSLGDWKRGLRSGRKSLANPLPLLGFVDRAVHELAVGSGCRRQRSAVRSSLAHTPKSKTTLNPKRRALMAVAINRPSRMFRLPSAMDSPKSGFIHSSGVNRRARCSISSRRATVVLPAAGSPTMTYTVE
jgi:hypothetical protein